MLWQGVSWAGWNISDEWAILAIADVIASNPTGEVWTREEAYSYPEEWPGASKI